MGVGRILEAASCEHIRFSTMMQNINGARGQVSLFNHLSIAALSSAPADTDMLASWLFASAKDVGSAVL